MVLNENIWQNHSLPDNRLAIHHVGIRHVCIITVFPTPLEGCIYLHIDIFAVQTTNNNKKYLDS